MSQRNLLTVRQAALDTAGGRPLFRDLSLSFEATDRVAVVGRNGVGKSSLLQMLVGQQLPDRGEVVTRGRHILVPQTLTPQPGLSPGEQRVRALTEARDAEPDLLLLDEPTHDLDRDGIAWLVDWLSRWSRGLIVVSHDRRVLAVFESYFVVGESGCRIVRGGLDVLLSDLARQRETSEERYLRGLTQLVAKEKQSAADRQRRMRKKNLGRVRELKRCPARALLNDKRSYAQEKQAKRALLRENRIAEARDAALAMRRALPVVLPLHVSAIPRAEPSSGTPVVVLENVTASVHGRIVFGPLTCALGHERVAIIGRNGAGKTTLAEILCGERRPSAGQVRADRERIGYVAQNATNWCDERSVIDELLTRGRADSPQAAAHILAGHRFPWALAQRPLRSLSPGERVRAALICLHQRQPTPELLVLDEPTGHLDFVGIDALEAVLRAWPGGLIVISHDDAFLQRINIQRVIDLGADR